MLKDTDEQYWAALDLGSNSFHLLLVRPYGSSFEVVERLKEKVQLFAGFSENKLTHAAQERGLACLARFAQRLKPVPVHRVCVMGTYALRQAGNREEFCARAEAILGRPVEVISGADEARLIYLAVAHHVPFSGSGAALGQRTPGRADARRMVVDIGGGSTEIAVGDTAQPDVKISMNLGCVGYKDRFFDGSLLQGEAYAQARATAAQEIEQALTDEDVGDVSRLTVFGTSGTIESVQTVLAANGWTTDSISAEALQRVETAVAEGRWLIEAGVPGLSPERTDIFPAGLAILSALFDVLKLQSMTFVDVSLLQGMVCDEVLGDVHVDLASDSVKRLAERFVVDVRQSERVRQRCLDLYEQSQSWWQGDTECRQMLEWAAQLHELGSMINPKHYHRHGAYIIKHADLPGFSAIQKETLSLLVRGHRRSMPGFAFQNFAPPLDDLLKKLLALLRIAAIIERGHVDDVGAVELRVSEGGLTLRFLPGWLREHPLSARELEFEAAQLAGVDLKLSFSD